MVYKMQNNLSYNMRSCIDYKSMHETIQICKKNNFIKYIPQDYDSFKEILKICKEFKSDPHKWGIYKNKFIYTPIKKIHIYRNPISYILKYMVYKMQNNLPYNMKSYIDYKYNNYKNSYINKWRIENIDTKYIIYVRKICNELLDTKFWGPNEKNICYIPIKNIVISREIANQFYIIFETFEGDFAFHKTKSSIYLKYCIESKYYNNHNDNIVIPIYNYNVCIFSVLCKLINVYDNFDDAYNDSSHMFFHKLLDCNNLMVPKISKFLLQDDEGNYYSEQNKSSGLFGWLFGY